MREQLNYTSISGNRKTPALVVYSLSTCGFCKRAMAFLDKHGFSYAYCHLDTISLDSKTAIKKELQETFGTSVAFPYLIIDDKEVLVGFIEDDWKKKLGVDNE